MAQHGGSGGRRSGTRSAASINAGARPTRARARRRFAITTGLAAVALTLLAGGAHSAPGDVTLVSTSSADVKGTGSSFTPAVSADGTVVAFTSNATNLDPVDTDTTQDVYVKNLVTGDLTLASTSGDGTKANAQSLSPHLSADGTAVAFEGYATNLDPRDAEGLPDIYVKNLSTGELSLASTSDDGIKGNGISGQPKLSGDGTKVAFSTESSLDPSDTNTLNDVYVKDVVTGDITLASTGDSGAQGNLASGNPALSADGTKVLFTSASTNLDAADGDSIPDAFVKDLVTGDVTLASRPAVGPKGNGASVGASLSADGTRVAFASRATNLHPADDEGTFDVYVKDLTTGALTLASVSDAGAKGNGESGGVLGLSTSLSGDGTRVAFMSVATNLDPADGDATEDIYVKDLETGDIDLASTSALGVKGDLQSFGPSLSSAGTKVAFSSRSTNLHPADVDMPPRFDIFLKEPAFGPPPTGADLALFLTDRPNPVTLGGDLTYTLDVFNNGPDDATSVEVSDDLPAGVTLRSATPSAGGACDTTGDPIVCRWPTLDASDSASIDIVVTTPDEPTTLTNTAFVSSATPDPAPANNSDITTTDVRVVSADLRMLTNDGPDPIPAGGELFYSFGLFNTGPDVATNVELRFDLPAGATVNSVTPSPGCDATSNPIVCRFPTVGLTAFITIFVIVTAPATAGEITATVTVTANEPDPDLTNNQATLTTTVLEAPANDPPVAGDDAITVPESGSHTFDARANDSPGPANEAAQTLAVQEITQGPAHGTASVAADGRIVYTPTPGFDGADSFSYRVCDDGTTAGAPDPRCDEAAVTVDIESFEEQLEQIIDTSPGPVADKVEDALEKIRKAEQKLAQTPPDRQGALGEYEGAVGEIAAAVREGLLPSAVGRSLMDRICASARKVAEDAIADAEARGGNASKLAEARQSLDEGDVRRSAGRFKDAVSRYKDAVSKAEGA